MFLASCSLQSVFNDFGCFFGLNSGDGTISMGLLVISISAQVLVPPLSFLFLLFSFPKVCFVYFDGCASLPLINPWYLICHKVYWLFYSGSLCVYMCGSLCVMEYVYVCCGGFSLYCERVCVLECLFSVLCVYMYVCVMGRFFFVCI